LKSRTDSLLQELDTSPALSPPRISKVPSANPRASQFNRRLSLNSSQPNHGARKSVAKPSGRPTKALQSTVPTADSLVQQEFDPQSDYGSHNTNLSKDLPGQNNNVPQYSHTQNELSQPEKNFRNQNQYQKPQSQKNQWEADMLEQQRKKHEDIVRQRMEQDQREQEDRELKLWESQQNQIQKEKELQNQRDKELQTRREKELQIQREKEIRLQRERETQMQKESEIQKKQYEKEAQIQREIEIQAKREKEMLMRQQQQQQQQLQRERELQIKRERVEEQQRQEALNQSNNARVPDQSQISICAYCGEGVVDVRHCVNAVNATWHPEHFFCGLCGKVFPPGTGFLEHEGLAYCEKDYFHLFGMRCNGCKNQIIGEYVSAFDREWHSNCFHCADCAQPFSQGTFFEHNGLAYCEQHYHQQRGSMCSVCSNPIVSVAILATPTEPNAAGEIEKLYKYHPEHLACLSCGKPLATLIANTTNLDGSLSGERVMIADENDFREKKGRPYCVPCYGSLRK
ncbi:hypothetical protein HK096_009171, partial [Nowakowskiella sp. JEL0078]